MQKFIALLAGATALNVVGIASFMQDRKLLGYGLVIAGLAVLFAAVILHARSSGKDQPDDK